MKLTNQTPKYVPGEVLLRLKNSGNTLSGDVLSEYGSKIGKSQEMQEKRNFLNRSEPKLRMSYFH